jgi:hypothetical protein
LEDFLKTKEFKDMVTTRTPQTLVIKAATTITTANAANAPMALSFEVVPGIQETPIEENVVLVALSKGVTGSATIFWVDRQDKDGGAAFIAEGALKPLKDWQYVQENSVAKNGNLKRLVRQRHGIARSVGKTLRRICRIKRQQAASILFFGV